MKRRGQTMVEFALVLPILGLILFGILDFGRAIYYYNGISESVGEAARAAALVNFTGVPDDAYVVAAAQAQAPYVVAAPCVNGPIPLSPTPPSGQAWLYVTGAGNADGANAPAGETGAEPGCDKRVAAQRGDRLLIRVFYSFSPMTPLIQQFTGSQLVMSASSIVPVEYAGG